MDRLLKFAQKLDKKTRFKVYACWQKILNNDLENMKIKKIEGFKDLFRVRIGNLRIIFKKTQSANEVINISFRKDAYKDL